MEEARCSLSGWVETCAFVLTGSSGVGGMNDGAYGWLEQTQSENSWHRAINHSLKQKAESASAVSSEHSLWARAEKRNKTFTLTFVELVWNLWSRKEAVTNVLPSTTSAHQSCEGSMQLHICLLTYVCWCTADNKSWRDELCLMFMTQTSGETGTDQLIISWFKWDLLRNKTAKSSIKSE